MTSRRSVNFNSNLPQAIYLSVFNSPATPMEAFVFLFLVNVHIYYRPRPVRLPRMMTYFKITEEHSQYLIPAPVMLILPEWGLYFS